MRVLHVTEALGGGITTAILAMVEATPDIEHHLVARAREAHDVGVSPEDRVASVAALPRLPLAAVRALRAAVRDVEPDVLHAHSSIAGVVARAAGLRDAPVVYSPHCFAFERTDVSRARRRAFAGVERALVGRTDVFAAVAPHELDLAADIGHDRLAYVPNRTIATPGRRARFSRPVRVAAVGRLSAQKDPDAFLRLSRYVRTHVGVPTTWTWIGGGDPAHERRLRAAGVEVTGWIPHEDLLGRLAAQQVYVHTAAWEAAPISILEAAALGLPMAVRSIPSLDSLDVPGRRHGIDPLARRIDDLTRPGEWSEAQEESLSFAASHGRGRQYSHLWDLYTAAVGRPPLMMRGPGTSLDVPGSPVRKAS